MSTSILAIDTATEACSAAVMVDGAVCERYLLAPRRHSALILPMVEEVLAEAGLALRQLDGLAFGRGPGSFTGLRIAAGVIQGLALATELPVAPVSTLQALAQAAYRAGAPPNIVAALDARRGEVYLGIYGAVQADVGRAAIVRPLAPETVADPRAIATTLPGTWIGIGSGFKARGQELRRSLAGDPSEILPDRFPCARHVALLGIEILRRGQGVGAEEALPAYVRDRVV